MNHRLAYVMIVGVVVLGTKSSVYAQTLDKPLQLASREPAFYAIIGSHLERAEARNVAALREHIAVHLHNATIPDALSAVEKQTSLRFAFKPSILPSGATVSLDASDITVVAALTQILLDADVDVEIAPYGLTSIVARQPQKQAPDSTAGTIIGRITDGKTHQGIPYATVSVLGTARTATANDSGAFRLTRVPAGTCTVVVRRVGYVASQQRVTVVSGQVATLDFTLDQSAGSLDQVVVTGALVPAAMKSIPTPITIVSDSEFAQQQPRTLNDIFRQAVPTAVAFDQFANQNQSYMSVRGATDLNQGATQVKTFIDGVEVATNAASPIDPASIDHIEVIRGPEAAAIYGSGAIDGVIQVFTKHGDATGGRPSVDAQVAAADVQTPYAGFRGVLRQTYSGDVRGGTDDASYLVGGGYTETNNYLPFGTYSAQSTPSVYSGIHYSKAMTTLDVSARYHVSNSPGTFNPEYTRQEAAGGSYTAPDYDVTAYTNTTIGASLAVQPLPSWRNVLTIGYDQNNLNDVQRRPRLTTPADTELAYSYQNRDKISIRGYPSLTWHLGSAVSGTFIAGADYWVENQLSTSSFGVLNTTTGRIQTDQSQPFSTTRYPTNNTGVFAQAQVAFFDALFLTGGVRADWNSDFGDSISTPVSPRVGIAYSHSLGFSTIKLRSSWGSAIMPPASSAKVFQRVGSAEQLANPTLGPERQHGGDGGFDLLFGQIATFSATYFNQVAVNLIQQVQVPSESLSVYQSQNVGTVTNSGVELEGRVGIGRLSLRVMYGYTRSRVDKLDPLYTGDYRIGDQTLDVPRHTGGASLSARLWRNTSIAGGLTYVGPWTDYNDVRENACFSAFFATGDTSKCPPAFVTGLNSGNTSTRPFLMQYPTLVKANLSVTQTFSPWASAFISIENIGDNQAYEQSNDQARVGRISTIGLRFHY
jgi:outer membrane receptor protein involved in Fe transport